MKREEGRESGRARRDMGTLNMGEANSSSPNGFELISESRAGVLGLSKLTARYIREWGGAVAVPYRVSTS